MSHSTAFQVWSKAGSNESLLKMQTLWAHQDLKNQNLHITKYQVI